MEERICEGGITSGWRISSLKYVFSRLSYLDALQIFTTARILINWVASLDVIVYGERFPQDDNNRSAEDRKEARYRDLLRLATFGDRPLSPIIDGSFNTPCIGLGCQSTAIICSLIRSIKSPLFKHTVYR